MRLSNSSGTLALTLLTLLACGAGSIWAAAPTIASPTNVDIFYDVENPAEVQFAYHIVAAGATAYDATGLPPNAIVDPTSGWINGNRNVPGLYNVAVRASNSDGVATATVRLAIHPAVVGVLSSQGVFHAGQTINVTLHYNAAVAVTGAPHLTLAIGPAGSPVFKNATYASGSGTSELVFQYVVTANDADPDGVQLLPSAPSGGTICDASGLVASPSLPVRHFDTGITIQAAANGLAGAAAAANSSAVAANGTLLNVSARMRVVEGDANRSLITGFVIAGTNAKRVLLRAIGPALAAFGVPGALADPRLRLYSSTGALVAENDDWAGAETSAAATAVGAFALAPGARDSATIVTLPPGAYTLVASPNGGAGVALAEVYDADVATSGASAIINLSARGQIDGETDPLIAGFSVQGAGGRRVLIRGIGPALAQFGVSAVLGDPTLKIYQDGQLVAQNDNWSSAAADVIAANTAAGAFSLAADSKDAALVLLLKPGSYTAVVSGVNSTSGAGLVEVYELPAKD